MCTKRKIRAEVVEGFIRTQKDDYRAVLANSQLALSGESILQHMLH